MNRTGNSSTLNPKVKSCASSGMNSSSSPSTVAKSFQDFKLTASEQLEILDRFGMENYGKGDWVPGAGWSQFLDPIQAKRKQAAEMDAQRENEHTREEVEEYKKEEFEQDWEELKADPDLLPILSKVVNLMKCVDDFKVIMERTIKSVADEQFAKVCDQNHVERLMWMVGKAITSMEEFLSIDKLPEATRLLGPGSSSSSKNAEFSLPCEVQDQEAFLSDVKNLSQNLSKIYSFLQSPDQKLETSVDKLEKLVTEMQSDLDNVTDGIKVVERYSKIHEKVLDDRSSVNSGGNTESEENNSGKESLNSD